MVPTDQYVISPMYTLVDEHGLAAALLVAAVILFYASRRFREGTRAHRMHAHLAQLPIMQRIATLAAAASAVVHFGLAFGHEPSAWTLPYVIGTVVLGFASKKIATSRRWRRWATVTLGGSIVVFAGASIAGNSPDQLAMMTKLIELTGLLAALSPAPGVRFAKLGATAGVFIATFLAIGGWVGAFGSGGGHHHGDTPPPSIALPVGVDREPTPEEEAAAEAFHADVVEAISKYSDLEVAAAAGYDVEGVIGLDFHADNPSLREDGRIFDPAYPETLVYAEGPDGPVLLGAMFQMDHPGQTGPAIGGPLTVWHAHDHICMSPFGMTGAQNPFGQCPFGSITMPITNEMIHVFVIDGAPDLYGDLEDDWISSALGLK